MDFKKERVNSHNDWPQITLFKAERKFHELLEKKRPVKLFQQAKLRHEDNPDYQKMVGHFLNGLEALPERPDYLFDHCFTVIDRGASSLFPGKGITGIVNGLGNRLIAHSSTEWESIIDSLTRAMPLSSYRYVAKNICEAQLGCNAYSGPIVERVRKFFEPARYHQFIEKFVFGAGLTTSKPISHEAVQQAANFLKLYASGSLATKRTCAPAFRKLDMSDSSNLLSPAQRAHFLLSLYAFIARNERAHGELLSPFRTSKADLKRYESYYFLATMTYTFALGVLELRGWGGITSAEIRECCTRNLAVQEALFR
ncbi:hypothetical protein B0G57_1419 [Trinickia symbiotica]|uniref:Uncharacterized protein n=1 Tax=Trinickia symbiotica TaxID=863227 RepID=A0A2N7WKJ2_9BURK|nr:hypothetical protein [Trinickia symbiotica]PMS29884.1 hypothetical protein C0Z20_30480 [Trinickia symbiotica]PPK41081.1 hypothetical protein B0G57_1419 [Trinickia symbiotica]